jgi:hypothetical protein
MTKPKGRRKKYKARKAAARILESERLMAAARKEFLHRRRLFLRYGRIFEILTKRREYMSKRRDCGNAQDGRPCTNCKAPAPAIALDQCMQKLIKQEKIAVGPKQPFKHPMLPGRPLVEYSRCPFFVANEALYFEAVTGPLYRSYLQNAYRQVCRGTAKDVERAINAIRDRTRPHLRSLRLLIPLRFATSGTSLLELEDPLWVIHDFINKIEAYLPKLKAKARSPAGPRGDSVRRSIYIAMLRVWKELTGRLPAANNTTFHDFAHAALQSIDSNATDNYNYEAATKTALKALK